MKKAIRASAYALIWTLHMSKLLQPACCFGSLAVTIPNDCSLQEKTLYV